MAVNSAVGAQQETGYVVRPTGGPCLVLRTAPSTDSARVDCLVPGTGVTAVDAVPFWRRVRLADGREGWSAKKFLEPVAPVVEEPALPDPNAIPPHAWLEVHIVDVGQGDGIWIRTFDDGVAGNGVFEGKNIVIDGGPNASQGEGTLHDYIESAGHHGGIIDALVVSHPHDDHYPGAARIIRHFDVLSYYDPGFPKGGVAYPAFLNEVKTETVEGTPIALHIGRSNFGVPAWGKEIGVRFLYAWPGSNEGLGSKMNTIENNASIVLRLTYGRHSFLFMGDAEGKERGDGPDEPKYVEKILMTEVQPDSLTSTVLKLAHHGSETSSTLPFMQAVNPEIIVASSGRKKFGQVFLPDASVLERYCQLNPAVRVYRTDRDDAAQQRTVKNDADGDHVVIRTNGKDIEVLAFVNGVLLSSHPAGC
ncbi:MAG: MBL fold metallo-hydrolase [Cytophagaceae bacterium]|nr:MBL fold metallo-hydrolase [Gemmatimonadaceae bacterium]